MELRQTSPQANNFMTNNKFSRTLHDLLRPKFLPHQFHLHMFLGRKVESQQIRNWVILQNVIPFQDHIEFSGFRHQCVSRGAALRSVPVHRPKNVQAKQKI